MDSYPDTGKVQVSIVYNIPVTNKYQVLEVDQVVQPGKFTIVRMASPLPYKSGNPAVSATPNIVLDKQDLENLDPMLTSTDAHQDTTNLPPEFHKCKAQIGTKFGCTPLTPICVYKGES